ncbi:MAG: YcgN family cysteine cluster protein [Moraxella sp.]|nr:YcgN family cysteine cluster protein [Moraxella sp.]
MTIRTDFWERYPLFELTAGEWEALCDGCGVCCLIKYLDDDDAALTEYTDVACQLLDCATGRCSDYPNRQKHVADCISLSYEMIADMLWLPSHCAYKRLYLGQGLPPWHRLMAGEVAHQQGLTKVGVAGRCVSELVASEEETEERIVRWVKI